MSEFDEFREREQRGWSDYCIVDAYIEHFVPITDKIGKGIVGKHIKANDRVLDLCCGSGTLSAAISDIGAQVTGLDFSPEMVAKARETVEDAEIIEGDAMAMPFESEQFDKVVCNFGFMHIADQPKALSEVRRVLKHNGQFIMATWVGPDDSPAFSAVFGALKAHADFSLAPAQPDLFALANPEKAKAMMASAGLDLIELYRVDAEWVLKKPTDLFEIFLTATVGAGMLIRSQTLDTLEQIAETIKMTVIDKHLEGLLFRVPVPVAVLAARAQ